MSPALTILTFHALDDSRAVISFSPALFERLVRMLRRGGYGVVSLMDAAEGLRCGAALPERSLAISFDDGYRSVYEVAFPILREHDMPATVFLTVGDPQGESWRGTRDSGARLPSMEGRAMLSWGEIREMQRAGMDFGAHTLTHPDLTRLTPSRVEREMVVCKTVLEEALGTQVAGFAYPFGRHSAVSLQLAQRHFAFAVSDRLGLANPGSDIHALPRVDGYYLRHPWVVSLLAKPWFPWYVRARSVPRNARSAVLGRVR